MQYMVHAYEHKTLPAAFANVVPRILPYSQAICRTCKNKKIDILFDYKEKFNTHIIIYKQIIYKPLVTYRHAGADLLLISFQEHSYLNYPQSRNCGYRRSNLN